MIIFDQLGKNDRQLRLLAQIVFVGMVVLLAGLWWVQIVSYRNYQANQQTQSFRTVRVPAMRGKILDRNGVVLADSRPEYNVSLYLEELRDQFQKTYKQMRPVETFTNSLVFWKRWLGVSPVQRRNVKLDSDQLIKLGEQVRERVVGEIVQQVCSGLKAPGVFDPARFKRHYDSRLALPYPLLANLTPTQIARFEEQPGKPAGVELDVQATRFYPQQTLAAHLIGHLRSDVSSQQGEDATFDYRLPDYRGVLGIEYADDAALRGKAGAKSVLVNNLGYRQTENIWSPVEPGSNVVLTIDSTIQKAAEDALHRGPQGVLTKGAVVVMDVNTGDILALASSPTFDPNDYIKGYSQADYTKMQESGAEQNLATGGSFMPGSIFKPIVGLACLENGMNPEAKIYNPPNPADPAHGHIKIGSRTIKDTARPGDYNFRRAIACSSNTYFITNGIRYAGIERIINLGQKFHFGEDMDLGTLQDANGALPSLKQVRSRNWQDGYTANICFGQGEVNVTPIQMAVAYSAIANGGKVLWPRLIDRIEPQDSVSGGKPIVFEKSRVRDNLGVSLRNIKIVHEAMLAETEDPEGTGHSAVVQGGPRICGKTGTAQNNNHLVGWNYWFASFAPYENPRYAVVVMVQSQSTGSGGSTAAPIAHDVYAAIMKTESRTALATASVGSSSFSSSIFTKAFEDEIRERGRF